MLEDSAEHVDDFHSSPSLQPLVSTSFQKEMESLGEVSQSTAGKPAKFKRGCQVSIKEECKSPVAKKICTQACVAQSHLTSSPFTATEKDRESLDTSVAERINENDSDTLFGSVINATSSNGPAASKFVVTCSQADADTYNTQSNVGSFTGIDLENAEDDSTRILTKDNTTSNEAFVRTHYLQSVNELPTPILLHVFSLVPLHDRLKRAALVCKYWRDLVNDAQLWRVIDFSRHVRVDRHIILRVTGLSGNVTSLNFNDCRHIDDDTLIAVLKQCSTLQELFLVRCDHLSEQSLSCIGQFCSRLKRVDLSCCLSLTDQSVLKLVECCPLLSSVALKQCTKLTDQSVTSIACHCTQLKHFSIDQCDQLTDASLSALIDEGRALESLSCMSCHFTESVVKELSRIPSLRCLDLPNIAGVTDEVLKSIVRACLWLTSVNLSLCQSVSNSAIDCLVQCCPRLDSLYAVQCNIDDTGMESIGRCGKLLRHLDVAWCSRITKVGVEAVVKGCPMLTYVGLMRCDEVTEKDADEFVARYPRIRFSTFVLDCRRLLERATTVANSGDLTLTRRSSNMQNILF